MPALMTLAGGYAFEVTPEKDCWLFNPFRFEKNPTFSPVRKISAVEILSREISEIGRL